MRVIPIILSGGSGSRLWPLSRQEYPKQIIDLVGDHSLFQETLFRAAEITKEKPLVIANYAHRYHLLKQANEINIDLLDLILEPVAKNTAPALALAALYLLQKVGPGAVMLVMPADHVVKKVSVLKRAVDKVLSLLAKQKILITFGIAPTTPETNYGYIQAGGELAPGIFSVREFVEKPDQATAEQYLKQGNYSWNSGMFLFSAQTFLDQLAQYEPGILECAKKALSNAKRDQKFLIPCLASFEQAAAISIDYAVMEKTSQAAVIPVDLGWSDVGSWASLASVLPQDDNHNVTQGDVILKDVKNSYIRAENKLVAAVGIEDHVIVETNDAVLVAHKNCDQEVKKIVEQLKASGRFEAEHHVTVYRPWGSYTRLIELPGVRVNYIKILAGKAITKQVHYKRSEHWVIIHGVAEAGCDGTITHLHAEESTFIARGQEHYLKNEGDQVLEVVEVQTGDYFGEDDIVRYEL